MSFILEVLSSATVVASLIGLATYMGRTLIVTRITNGVKHEFAEKLEQLRSELNLIQTKYEAGLKSQENDIATLRATAASGLTTRQAAIDSRIIAAVDKLWNDAMQLHKMRSIVEVMKNIDFDRAAEMCQNDTRHRVPFDTLYKTFDFKIFKESTPSVGRPFLSDYAWTLFAAFSAIIGVSAAKLHVLSQGWPADVVDRKSPEKLVRALTQIPGQGEGPPMVIEYHLETIQEDLLKELRRILDGRDEDRGNVERVHAAMEFVRELKAQRTLAEVEAEKIAAV